MKNVQDLIADIEILEIVGDTSTPIESISFDSRTTIPQSLFVSAQGVENDGHTYIEEAIRNGAKAIVYEKAQGEKVKGVVYIKVKDSRKTLGYITQNFFNHPSRKLKLVGVTGTNGKTTTATLLFEIFKSLGHHVALISTVENKIDDTSFPTNYTTPTPITLTSFLAKAVEEGVEYAFMECSSHGIEEERIAGLEFVGGIFTNITLDHLDFHKTFENYVDAKKKFFDHLPKNAFALSNIDDPKGEYMLEDTSAQKYFFGINGQGDFVGKDLKSSLEGLSLTIDDTYLQSNLIGQFNAYNLLGVYGASVLIGIDKKALISIIKEIHPPAGRLQFVKSKEGVYGIVDYAHTPDALENILKTLNEIKTADAKIITIVGCGGDRDKTKRPIMGALATKLSNYTIFTSDNPRSENPEFILKDIVVGIPQEIHNYESIVERTEAIKKGVNRAKPGDIVIIAGKGHENYQIFSDKTIHFSDLEELQKNFSLY